MSQTTLPRPTPPSSLRREVPEDTVLAKLSGNVLLVAPSFHFWRGRYMLSGDQLRVNMGDEDVTSAVTASQAKVFTANCPLDPEQVPWFKKFSKVKAAYNNTIAAYSVPFPIRAVRIVMLERADTFLEELEARGRELRELAVSFGNDYDAVMRQIRANLGETIWNQVAPRLPQNAEKLTALFGVDATPVQLGSGNMTSPGLQSLQQNSQLVRESLRRHVDDAISRIMVEPRQALVSALENLTKLVSDGKKVTTKSLGPVQTAVTKLRNFASVVDSRLLQQIAVMERSLNATIPSELTTESMAGSGLAAVINDTITAAQDRLAINNMSRQQFGCGVRNFVVVPQEPEDETL